MTRSMILAILAFSLLILANLAVFGYLNFRSFSERVVTSELMEGLNETQRLLNQDRYRRLDRESNRQFTRMIAPRLERYTYIRAIVLLDRHGNVVHREMIGRSGVRPAGGQTDPSLPAGATLRMVPVQNPAETLPDENRLALEYDAEIMRREVNTLRSELNNSLLIAIAISLALLLAGLTYVVWSYKRNKMLQIQARKADRLAYVGTLSSGLAHEIRNPLNSMNMNVQLIQEELEEMGFDLQSELSDMLEGTRKEIGRLERLVSSFLAYARPTRLTTAPCDVNELIEETRSLLEPEIEKNGIRLTLTLAKDLPQIQLDRGQMKQALINVIQNSVQVLQHGQVLEVVTRKAGGDKVLIAVRDEGPGISPEERKDIFKEFYSTRKGGTGLGLPIAQRIAELHMGGIKVESEVGKGTTLTFILPMELQDGSRSGSK